MEKRNQGKFQRAALQCTTMAKENFDKRYENAAEVGEVEQYIGLCNEARLKTSDEWWVGERCCGAGLSEASA